MYSAKITYGVYDSNSSLFLELIRTIIETEFTKQRNTLSKTFLPKTVKGDEYLLSPIADKEIDPAFCSIIKAKMEGTNQRFADHQDDLNHYIIGIMADGLVNLRKITDAVYIILNDMDVKNYIFNYQNSEGENLISDSGKYFVKNLSTEFEVSKTMNDKEIVYGYLVLQAEICEVTKFNTHPEIEYISTTNKLGANEIELKQTTHFEDTPPTPPTTFTLTTSAGIGGSILQSYTDEAILNGKSVPLVAIADEGYIVDQITVNGIEVTENPFIVTITENTEVIATFTEN
jgi:hypothetical protein